MSIQLIGENEIEYEDRQMYHPTIHKGHIKNHNKIVHINKQNDQSVLCKVKDKITEE